MTDFLPGVPAEAVLAALSRPPGNELASGKFASPESSAALAVNAFGWFLERPRSLQPGWQKMNISASSRRIKRQSMQVLHHGLQIRAVPVTLPEPNS